MSPARPPGIDRIARVLPGRLLDAPREDRLRWVEDGALAIDHEGRIAARGGRAAVAALYPPEHVPWQSWPQGALPLITPGLIDAHAHLPQYPVVARTESALLPWLQRHVFPVERRFTADAAGRIEGAIGAEELDRRCTHFFRSLRANGTTAAMVYGAVWEDSCDAGFAAADRSGLRVALGKVMMDRHSYGDTGGLPVLEVSVAESRRLIERWHGAADGRLRYVVSPRFAVSCSMEMMRAAAELARATGCPVQTHLAEQPGEIGLVRDLFPDRLDYTDVYDHAGLLGPGCVLGHSIHLSDREIETIAARGAGVAHCPTSNLFLNSGLCPVDRLHAAGVPLALGSDVAGGPELNLWQVMRSAIEVQTARRLAARDEGIDPLTPVHAFHLATAGGARVLRLEEQGCGRLEPGAGADLAVWDLAAVLADPAAATAAADVIADGDLALSLMIYRGGPGALLGTTVQGADDPAA